MPTQEDIDQQHKLLSTHRRTLGRYLDQRANLGPQHAPPGVLNGIDDTRAEIARIKAVLRGWGVAVEALPGDVETPFGSRVRRTAPAGRSRPWFWSLGRRGDDLFDPEIERRNRQVLIADMRLRINERLETAPKLIPLRLTERAGVVEPPGVLIRPYDLARRRPGQPDELLPARTKIADLYAEHNRQLLILGAPGAGKTFLLHELARDLVAVAAHDETAPIPVIFSLASWPPGLAIDVWMVADLARRFGAKPGLFTRLLRGGALLPLLDGLDEVATPDLRIQCVAAINTFRHSQDLLLPLVVTCREHEYAELPPLQVNTAIAVQPLAPAQIDRYLAGPTFEGMRAALRSDPQLADVARTPLLLGLMAAIYRDRAPQLPAGGDAAALHAVILGDYIDRCLELAKDPHALHTPAPQLRAFLGWLACELTAHANQQDFYLEFLQPSWLPSRAWRWVWYAASGLISGLIAGSGFGLGLGLVLGSNVGLKVGLVIALSLGLSVGRGAIVIVENLTWSWKKVRLKLHTIMLVGVFVGLVSGVVGGVAGGVAAWLGFKLMSTGILRSSLAERFLFNQGIRRSLRSAMVGGLGIGLASGLSSGLGFALSYGILVGVVAGLGLGLVGLVNSGLLQYGGVAVVKHYALRLLLPLCTPAPLNFARWLEEARMRGLLVRVGGGYRFYHELLQCHFAAHAEPGIPRVPILAESEHVRTSVG